MASFVETSPNTRLSIFRYSVQRCGQPKGIEIMSLLYESILVILWEYMQRWLDLRKSLSKQFKDGSDSDVFPVSLRVKLWPSDPSQVTDDLAR